MISEMKLLIVVGARPNFMKAAPILKAIGEFNRSRSEWAEAIVPVLVHTGQHYDAQMSDAFFAELDLPQPDVFLGAGSGSHAAQTAEIMRRFEPVLLEEKPDALLVVGDVNSTLACALVASKFVGKSRPAIAHVEAGLRSCDRSMPEEINRILTDQISDLLFVTEDSGLRNLRVEGIPADRIHFVGNTMIDSLREYESGAELSPVTERLGLKRGEYTLLTLHRAANVDDRESFTEILEGLEDLANSHRIIFPAHPRTQKQIRELGLGSFFGFLPPFENHKGWGSQHSGGIQMIEPQGYLDFLCLMKHARLVVTDSGGIQEETTALGVPCVTVRDNTERPVTVQLGTNILAGTKRETIRPAIQKQLALRGASRIPEMWDGRAGARIVGILAERLITHVLAIPELQPETAQIQENAR
ncbi:MAG: UDP-N-acetylglucosamine 2-epimerase [Candidatus Acidoferrum typicum]|nr:UDP-N-acetylglucosamine 2-epimerase [Candidatus Acidoferrum typicum]